MKLTSETFIVKMQLVGHEKNASDYKEKHERIAFLPVLAYGRTTAT